MSLSFGNKRRGDDKQSTSSGIFEQSPIMRKRPLMAEIDENDQIIFSQNIPRSPSPAETHIEVDEDENQVDNHSNFGENRSTHSSRSGCENNLSLCAVENSLVQADNFTRFKTRYNPNLDIVVVKIFDVNPDYKNELKSFSRFFADDIDEENVEDFTSLLTNEVINRINMCLFGRDSLLIRLDFTAGFIDYMCDAANNSKDGQVDFTKYNMATYESSVNVSNVLSTDFSPDEYRPRPSTKVAKSKDTGNKNLHIRNSILISNFGTNMETARTLASCRVWVRGIIESRQLTATRSGSGNKTFTSFLLRVDMAPLVFVNSYLRNDEYFQLARGFYIYSCNSSYKRYFLNEKGERTVKAETSYDLLKDQEVIVEFNNMEIFMINSTKFLLRGMPKRIIEMSYITKTR